MFVAGFYAVPDCRTLYLSHSLIIELIQLVTSANFGAMFRLSVLFISLLWASLMLISYSGATPQDNPTVEVSTSVRS